MPKSKLADYISAQKRRDAPPIDWLWAAILERKMVLKIDLKQMAEIAGVSYETMRRYIGQSPWEWSADARTRVCKEFGLKPIQTVQPAPDEMWGLRV